MLRKTKIICTLGPATEDEAVLRRLMLGRHERRAVQFLPLHP